MKRSEIFEAFVKIAQEKGMISNDSSDSKKKLEKTHRADSLDISDIEALYGVKPDSSKALEYKKNIMEVAHPTSVVISPSYDKLNGLVENNIERQNILLHIVNKQNNGLSTQHKYAKELIYSLVRVANTLDNDNQDDLYKLADVCLAQASKKSLKKEALWPAAAAVAAVLGIIYAKNHLKFHSDGFKQDTVKLMAEIDDLLQSNSSIQTEVGAGYEYTPEFLQTVVDLKNKVYSFAQLVNNILPVLDNIQEPRTGKELIALANKPDTQEAVKAYNEFKTAYSDLLPYISKIQQNFSDESYKNRAIKEKGFMSSLIDTTEVLHGGKGLIADDFDDVNHALQTFMSDALSVAKALQKSDSIEKDAAGQLQSASSESQKQLEPMPSNKEPASQIADLEKELSSIPGLS